MCTATVTRKGVGALLRSFTSQSQSADLIFMPSSWSWSRRRYSAADKPVPVLDMDENHAPAAGVATAGVHDHEAHELSSSTPPRTPAVRTNSNILNRLRQLSVTEASNLQSHPDCGSNAQFDPELMKAVLARNRVKGGKSQSQSGPFRNNRRTDQGDRFGDIPNDASSDRFLKMHNIRTRFSYRNPTSNKRPRNTFDDEDDRYD